MNDAFKQLLVDHHLYRHYVYFLQYIVIAEFCLEDKNSIDVGCSRGQNTFAMAKKSQKVYAFDPLTDLLDSLKNKPNLDNFLDYLIWPNVNLLDKVIYRNAALGNHNEVKDFFVYEKRSRSRFNKLDDDSTLVDKIEIEIKKLDEFNITNVSFIKINTEGYDYKVIEGAENLIKNQQPFIMSEFVSDELPFSQQDLTLINNLNYTYYRLISEFNNLEFVLFYPVDKDISNLKEKIEKYNLFWVDKVSAILRNEKRLNQFKLELVNYFKEYY